MDAQGNLTAIDPVILDQQVAGYRLDFSRFGDALTADRPVLLVFLRHFG